MQEFNVNVIFIDFVYFYIISLIFGMEEVQEQQIGQMNNMVEEAKGETSPENENTSYKYQATLLRQYIWWFEMAIFAICVLSGQSVATILGRLYYDKGGNSKWMATFVQNGGFPILIPFLFLTPNEKQTAENTDKKQPSLIVHVSLYLFLGIFLAADCMLYSIGLLYLPVSTYTLISASQLGFNAFFSYFLNSQKLTPYIINSLVLLTISSILLVFAPDSSDSNIPKGKSRFHRFSFHFLSFHFLSHGVNLRPLFISIEEIHPKNITKHFPNPTQKRIHPISQSVKPSLFQSVFNLFRSIGGT